jgi:flagellar biosynthesis protein FlhA
MDATPPPAPTGAGNEGLVMVGVLGVLAVMILPLPPVLLDLLLAFNMACSVLILMVSLRLTKPLDFSVFPSLLLITTLLRLGLNISTTRLILTHGHVGVGAAGEVIAAFGRFAAGGSLVVGGCGVPHPHGGELHRHHQGLRTHQ